MSTGNAMMFANCALFDLMLARYITANPVAFSGVIPVPACDMELEFGVDGGTPSMDLTPQAGGCNFAIHLPITLKIYTVHNGQRGDCESSAVVNVVIAPARMRCRPSRLPIQSEPLRS